MTSAYEKFEELEARIVRTVELVKTLQKELAGARGEIGRLERENQELRQEREIVKNKIELLLENMSELNEESLV